MIARCVRGLEWVLAAEVADRLAASDIQLSERRVSFTLPDLTPDLLALRTADDVLLHLGVLDGIDHTHAALADLPRELARIDFDRALDRLETVRKLPARLSFDVVAGLLGRRNYNRFAVEDTAGEFLTDTLGAQYLSRNPAARSGTPAASDLTFRLDLHDDCADVSLRLPRRPLHRRPWKLDTGPGTLHPPLAAALAQIAAAIPDLTAPTPSPGTPTTPATALDPFCGDGTIAIELALTFPGLAVLAADLDADRLHNAQANAARAFPTLTPTTTSVNTTNQPPAPVQFLLADAGHTSWPDAPFDLLVTNPPWDRSVGAAGALADTLDPFWQQVPASLTEHGRVCTIADADLDMPDHLRRIGYAVSLTQTVRLAGRVSHVVLATPPGSREVRLSPTLELWRERAIQAGIVSTEGF